MSTLSPVSIPRPTMRSRLNSFYSGSAASISSLCPRTERPSSDRNTCHPRIVERRNVVIFGDVGVGKSSLVNLITGEDRARTSHNAESCTLQSKEYKVPHGNIEFALHDTAGLHEAQIGKREYLEAICNAHTLVSKLERSGGINLLVFVMKAGRISSSMQETYNLFVRVLCSPETPVVVAVTHLEDYDDMEEWWGQNEKAFTKYQLSFLGHACVTATRGRKDQYIEKYQESKGTIWKLIMEQSGSVWKVDKTNWLRRVASKLRTRLSPRHRKKLNDGDLKKTLIKQCGFSPADATAFARRIMESQEASEDEMWFDVGFDA